MNSGSVAPFLNEVQRLEKEEIRYAETTYMVYEEYEGQGMVDLEMCFDCGAIVNSRDIHNRWHRLNDAN